MKPKDARPGVLYVSYDGLLEPLGESQVLGYLEHLAKLYRICLLTYEKPADARQLAKVAKMQQRCQVLGIQWKPMRYHKRPSLIATGWDVLRGCINGMIIAKREQISILHARSYVAAFMTMCIGKLTGIPFLFDTRGFWVDERVDGGLWASGSIMYRIAKKIEYELFSAATFTTCLTQSAKRIIVEKFKNVAPDRISVIPTCVNTNEFFPEKNANEKLFTLGYVGTVGNWYRFDLVLEVVRILFTEVPHSRFFIVNRNEHVLIKRMLKESGIDCNRVTLLSLDVSDVPAAIRSMSAGIVLCSTDKSNLGRVPTRFAEFLACGKPFMCNHGLGDLSEILASNRVGISVDCEMGDYRSSILELVNLSADLTISERARAVAIDSFSIMEGARTYQLAYDHLLSRFPPARKHPISEHRTNRSFRRHE